MKVLRLIYKAIPYEATARQDGYIILKPKEFTGSKTLFNSLDYNEDFTHKETQEYFLSNIIKDASKEI